MYDNANNVFVKAIAHLAEMAECWDQFTQLDQAIGQGWDDWDMDDVNTVIGNLIERRHMLSLTLDKLDRLLMDTSRLHRTCIDILAQTTPNDA